MAYIVMTYVVMAYIVMAQDINRTFPDQDDFSPDTANGQRNLAALKNILIAFSWR